MHIHRKFYILRAFPSFTQLIFVVICYRYGVRKCRNNLAVKLFIIFKILKDQNSGINFPKEQWRNVRLVTFCVVAVARPLSVKSMTGWLFFLLLCLIKIKTLEHRTELSLNCLISANGSTKNLHVHVCDVVCWEKSALKRPQNPISHGIKTSIDRVHQELHLQ